MFASCNFSPKFNWRVIITERTIISNTYALNQEVRVMMTEPWPVMVAP